MPSYVVELGLVLLSGLGVLYYAGYGPARWILPKEYEPYRLLVMPLIGYAFLIGVGIPLTTLGLTVSTIAWVLIAVCSIINFLAWRYSRSRPPGKRELPIAPLLAAALALALVVLPLFVYGTITVIGYNGDATLYIAQAELAKTHAMTGEAMNAVSFPFASSAAGSIKQGDGVGFQFFHSLVSYLLNRDAFFSYLPLLALFYGLGVLQAYAAYRVSFRLERWSSVLALPLVLMNSVLLWVTFDNFVRQTAAVALLPLALSSAHVYLETRSVRSLFLAALLLPALIATFPEILPFYGLPLAIFLLFKLVEERQAIRRTLFAGASLGLVSVALGPFAYRQLLAITILKVPITLARGVGYSVPFLRPDESLGVGFLTMASNDLQPKIDPQWQGALVALVSLSLLLSVAAIAVGLFAARSREHRMLLAAGLATILLLAWMRFGISYPYGYMKSLANSVYVIAALLMLGFQSGVNWISSDAGRSWMRPALYGAVGLIILAEAISAVWLEATITARPAPATAKLIRMAGNKRFLPSSLSIYLSLDEQLQPPMYWAAYLLRDHPLYGNGHLGYDFLRNAKAGMDYDAALLRATDDPRDYGFTESDRVWLDWWTVLYKRR